ncbi:hypothetical protein TO64_20365 [Citrobacter freundii]|nr:hypothetical protein TO64_20365 [Citrobacter freundii]PCQ41807.1 hypothetical protein CQA28_15830 [Citrobacter freundii]PMC99919.1 hypothetical protein CJ200_20690 [Citrobacter freundii]
MMSGYASVVSNRLELHQRGLLPVILRSRHDEIRHGIQRTLMMVALVSMVLITMVMLTMATILMGMTMTLIMS